MAGGAPAVGTDSWNYFLATWMVELLHMGLVLLILVLPYLYDTRPRVKTFMRYLFDRGNRRPTPETTPALRGKWVNVVRPRGEPITDIYSPRFKRQDVRTTPEDD